MRRPNNHKIITATTWWLFTCILLCLPGSQLPQASGNWFEQVYADKWIHIFLFAVLVFLWCRAVTAGKHFNKALANRFIAIAILCCLYGIAMEFVQKWLIPGRGFEAWDIAADGAGCLLGYFIAYRRLKKHKPALD